jgi:hypothetical protein
MVRSFIKTSALDYNGERYLSSIINRIQAIRDSEVRATLFFTNKKHALNTLKMASLLRSDVMRSNRVSGHLELVRLGER